VPVGREGWPGAHHLTAAGSLQAHGQAAPRSVAHTLNNLALVLEARGRNEEAAKYRRRIEASKNQ